jgi:hypothetical protein
MNFPVAPLALLMALVPFTALVAMAHWRFSVKKSYTLVTCVSFAVGVALFILSATVAASYSFQSLRLFRDSFLVVGVPALCYVVALVAIGLKGKVPAINLVLGGAVGVLPLCFLGFYAMLLSACSFEDCL